MNRVVTEKTASSRGLSPEEMARQKAKAAARARRSLSCLVPIQPHGSKTPFFCIHPHAGVVFPYYELAFLLGKEQPFYGLQSMGIARKEQPLNSIEEMAARYIAAVRKVRSEGPYALGGWSLGAPIAFEMARQLRQAGQSVSLLVSLDGKATSSSKLINGWDMFRFFFTSVVRDIWPYVFDFLNLTSFIAPNLSAIAEGNQSDLTGTPTPNRSAEIAKALVQKTDSTEFRISAMRRLLPVIWANTKAWIDYRPQVYPDRMVLLQSQNPFGNVQKDPTLGWGDLAQGGVEIHQISGSHLKILRQPDVRVLAETLKVCLDGI